MSISLGELIRRRIRDDRRSAQEICNELGMSRGNLDKIYKKDSINTDLLAKLCVLLQFDFFEYVNPFKMAGADLQPQYLAREDAVEYRTPLTRLQKCMGDLHDTERELDRVEKEVVHLRNAVHDKDKIIGLMQEQVDYLKSRLQGS
jgi:DNA-binding Xre family transcriptional regulator